MKSNQLIILFVFIFNFAFSQEKIESTILIDSTKSKTNFNIWSIDVAVGVSNGTRPYTKGYYTNANNQLFNNFKFNSFTVGGKYNFSKFIGAKIDLAFDRYINSEDGRSKPFEVAQYRTSIQGVLNLSSLAKPKKDFTKFNLYFHAGINLAILYPISADYNKIVSTGDQQGGLVLGITPTIKISDKIAAFIDLSSYNNYGQNLTWNGKHSAVSNNAQAHMYSAAFGLSFNLDKK